MKAVPKHINFLTLNILENIISPQIQQSGYMYASMELHIQGNF